MRVDRLTTRDVTVFADAEFAYSPGLNVFIGANGTGKSHVMKLLYAVTRSIMEAGPLACDNRDSKESNICEVLGRPVLQSLEKVFRTEPGGSPLTSLIRRDADEANIKVDGDFGTVAVDLKGSGAGTNLSICISPGSNSIFVPAAEVLSIFRGFVSAYERRELSFDGTFRDLCVDLSATPLHSVSPPALEKLATELENDVGGRAVLRGDRFYVSLSKDWLLEAPMLAEGLRKLASVAHLIRNGSITEKSVLFWDEPETNMNPTLITHVARMLLTLASVGIQVFVATHDYLLTNELSLAAEYRTPEGKAANVKFFCLCRDELNGPVRVRSGATISDIHDNPILQEFAAHYDRERDLFYRSEAAGDGGQE